VKVDAFEMRIQWFPTDFQDIVATVIAKRIRRQHSSSAKGGGRAAADVPPPGEPAKRTRHVAGGIVQCQLHFAANVNAVGEKTPADPPVLTMITAFLAFIMSLRVFSRNTAA
jgi:hypothetical protein